MTKPVQPAETIAWITPPERQGQTVDVAYSKGADEDGWLWERTRDRSQGASADERATYRRVHLDDLTAEELESWQPWNRAPAVSLTSAETDGF